MSLKVVRYPDVETVTLVVHRSGLPDYVGDELLRVAKILAKRLGAVYDDEEPLHIHFNGESSLRAFIGMLDEYLLDKYRTFLVKRGDSYELFLGW